MGVSKRGVRGAQWRLEGTSLAEISYGASDQVVILTGKQQRSLLSHDPATTS